MGTKRINSPFERQEEEVEEVEAEEEELLEVGLLLFHKRPGGGGVGRKRSAPGGKAKVVEPGAERADRDTKAPISKSGEATYQVEKVIKI